MFLAAIPPFIYADPWVKSFDERLRDLQRGSRRVAYFYHRPDSSTFRYRVYNMIQALEASADDISAAYFTESDLKRIDRIVKTADVLVVCRACYTDRINYLIMSAKERGCRVFFDVDDLVFDTDYVHLIVNTVDADLSLPGTWDYWFAYTSRIATTLRLCDKVIVTNDFLASHVRRCFDKQTSVIPNFINREQLDFSRQIFKLKAANGFAGDGRIHLGYFSGTPTHDKDFYIVAGAVARLLDRDPRLVVRIVGLLNTKECLLRHQSRVEVYPLHDFINLQRLIGSTEINLVPLQDNTFTNCKSELKYFEAGIVGTITVASPTFIFRRVIRDGENGYLANAQEWETKLQAVLDSMGSYSEIAKNAFQHSEDTYSWVNQKSLIRGVLFE